MRAVGLRIFGGPEVLEVLDLPAEPLGAGQVRVRVTAAAVNPVDTGRRAGLHADGDRPSGGVLVPGMDIAGVLREIGPDTDTDLAVGDHVMGIVAVSGPHGGYREDLVLPALSVTRVPAGASDVAAATLPMNALTARLALDVLGLTPGQVLAVTGAAGAFGGYAVQLAKTEGLTVIADASDADEALVRDLGADIVVRRGVDVADRIRAHHPDGVHGLVDGALLNDLAVPAVSDGGAMAALRGYTGDGQRGVRVIPVVVRDYAEERTKLDRLRELVEQGALTLRVADVYPAEHAADAHRRLEAGGVRGRLVLQF